MADFDLNQFVPSHIQAFETYYPSKPDRELMPNLAAIQSNWKSLVESKLLNHGEK